MATGVVLPGDGSLPSWPYRLKPQQYVAPPVVTPQVCSFPTVSVLNVRPPETAVVEEEGLVDPSPSSPFVFQPQQYALPPLVSPQECHPPEAIETISTLDSPIVECSPVHTTPPSSRPPYLPARR